MINTVNIKEQQLSNGYFQVGTGAEKILIMGSCRVCPYVEYFHQWNMQNGNRFTIYSLDPFNFNWNSNDDRVDYAEALKKWETDDRMIGMVESVDIFLHEYYQNAAMFNVNKGDNKTIYDFGMNPKIDVCIPNWNDYFVLFGDIISFDLDIRKKAIQDYNVIGYLSDQVLKEIFAISQNNLKKFYEVCRKSDIPEMEDYFRDNFTKKRFWWSYNHVSKWFTLSIFKFINDKYLHLDLTKGFDENHKDLFANNFTYLTDLDVKYYGYDWGEEIKPLRSKL